MKTTKKRIAVCVWTQETIHDYWDTSCKNAHVFNVGDPKENNHKYCPYCGKKIKTA